MARRFGAALMAVPLSVEPCKTHADETSGSGMVKPADTPAKVPAVAVDDYEPRAAAMLDKMLAAYSAAGDCSTAAAAIGKPCDCDKAAAAIMTFMRDNQGELGALTSFEHAHAGAKQRFETQHHDKVDALGKSADGLLVESCKDNKAMQDVLKVIE